MPVSIDPRRSGLGAAAPHMLLRGGEQVTREGRALHKFINNVTGIGAGVVLTNAAIVYNIRENRRILLACLMLGLHTLNDWIHVELGWTTLINGGGVFTPLTVQHEYHTGAAQDGPTFEEHHFYPLMMAEYSQGARSITVRVTANDVNADISLCWSGWWEFE